jgi:hypothetical protein
MCLAYVSRPRDKAFFQLLFSLLFPLLLWLNSLAMVVNLGSCCVVCSIKKVVKWLVGCDVIGKL